MELTHAFVPGVILALTMSLVASQVGLSGNIGGLAKAWILTWALSQATKPIRLGLSIALAPFIERRLSAWKPRLDRLVRLRP